MWKATQIDLQRLKCRGNTTSRHALKEVVKVDSYRRKCCQETLLKKLQKIFWRRDNISRFTGGQILFQDVEK